MCSEDIRSGDVCRLKQGMKIGDEITCCARHRNGHAPAKMIRITKTFSVGHMRKRVRTWRPPEKQRSLQAQVGRSKCQHHSCNRTQKSQSEYRSREPQEIFRLHR